MRSTKSLKKHERKVATLSCARMAKTYSALVARQMPRPIHDKAAYGNAVEVVHALAGHKLNHDQDDYLTIMTKLVEAYESENVPGPKAIKGIDALRFLLEENRLTAGDLGELIGVNRSIAYRILRETRKLTAEHIRKLSIRFCVSADLFLA